MTGGSNAWPRPSTSSSRRGSGAAPYSSSASSVPMNGSQRPCTIASGTARVVTSSTGGAGRGQPAAMRTPIRRRAKPRPTAVWVNSALSTPRALRGSRHRDGQLTDTTPVTVPGEAAAKRSAAIAPIDAPTSTTGPGPGAAATAAATSRRSRSPSVASPSDAP